MASRKEKKAAKHAASSREEAVKSLRTAGGAAGERLQHLATVGGAAASEGAHQARARFGDLVDQYRPVVEENLRSQSGKLSDFGEKLGPQAQKFRDDLQDDYLPRARRTVGTANTVATAAVTAAIEAARQEFDKGAPQVKAAAVETPKKKGGAGKVLLVLGLTAVGATAGYVAWKKSRPVEDPWAPPADFARAHYPAAAATDSDSSEVSDTVAGAEAGDVASSLKGDVHGDTKPKEVKVDSSDEKPVEVQGSDKGASGKDGVKKAGAAGTAGSAAAAGSAQGEKGSEGSSKSEKELAQEGVESGRVIDPVGDPKENPLDPKNDAKGDAEKRGSHRADD